MTTPGAPPDAAPSPPPGPGPGAVAVLANVPMRAIAYYAGAITLFAFQDAMTKWVAALYPVTQVMFLRSIFSLVPLALLIWALGGIGTIRFARLPLHMARSAVLLASIVLWFYALKLLPLATAMTIGYAGALFMTALSVPMLGEKVGPRRWAALLVGFAGVIIAVRPFSTDLSAAGVTLGGLIAVGSAATFALAMILTRRLSATNSTSSIMLFQTGATLLLTAITLPFIWQAVVAFDLWILVAMGISGVVAQFCIVQAFRYGEVSILAPIEYSGLVWGVLLGWLIWSDIPAAPVFAGGGIIILSCLYIARRAARRQAALKPRP
ncbi:MAG: DMT family transporter [Alphaproteobacteria bacterium]